jgi:hypothetical protein
MVDIGMKLNIFNSFIVTKQSAEGFNTLNSIA